MRDISVVIPNFNRTQQLRRAVASVVEQSLTPKEVIIVDDNSTVDPAPYVAQFDNIIILRSRANLGPSAARNRGVDVATGSYIAFLDSDDHWLPTKLEKQRQLFEQRADLGLVYCDMMMSFADGTKLPSGHKLINKDIMSHLFGMWTAPNPSTLMFRRPVYIELGGMDEQLRSCEDHELWFRIANASISVEFVDEALSIFELSGKDRLSFDSHTRMLGVDAFLAKVIPIIAARAGQDTARNFELHYRVMTAFPVVKKQLFRDTRNSLAIAWRYLLRNPQFYLMLGNKLSRYGGNGNKLS